jgi:hypothetical protein
MALDLVGRAWSDFGHVPRLTRDGHGRGTVPRPLNMGPTRDR